MRRVVVIGAGIGGLTSAAVLAKSGWDVTILEAHTDPGGCSSTFYHQGYLFDAGATLPAGFYQGGPMDLVGKAVGIDEWSTVRSDPAMVVHLPDGSKVSRYQGEIRWQERREAFGPRSEKFWRWQEHTADALWNFALRGIPWPPQTTDDLRSLLRNTLAWSLDDFPSHMQPNLILDAFRFVSDHLRDVPDKLRIFIDAQLLISAQTISRRASALYGAAALDLPRRGTVHLQGGMIAIAKKLVEALQKNRGQIHYRQEVTRIIIERGRPVGVETKRKSFFPADLIVTNIPPWNLMQLIPEDLPQRLRDLPVQPQDGWGAFMVYIGLDDTAIPDGFPNHHQIIKGEPLGEGNTLFLSLSPSWDSSRAPEGFRALTISTHTDLKPWWQLYLQDKHSYDLKKQIYIDRVLSNAERVIPGIRDAADLILPGTPITFQKFTRRRWGWVGGFPQTHLLRSWGPRFAPGIWMVGDSIFPGQSTAAVALGGLHVANSIQNAFNKGFNHAKRPKITELLRCDTNPLG
jgi:C-3',4' desaturase CrtD